MTSWWRCQTFTNGHLGWLTLQRGSRLSGELSRAPWAWAERSSLRHILVPHTQCSLDYVHDGSDPVPLSMASVYDFPCSREVVRKSRSVKKNKLHEFNIENSCILYKKSVVNVHNPRPELVQNNFFLVAFMLVHNIRIFERECYSKNWGILKEGSKLPQFLQTYLNIHLRTL